MANTRGLRPYLEQQMGIDSTQMKDFIRGLKTGVKASEDEKQKLTTPASRSDSR